MSYFPSLYNKLFILYFVVSLLYEVKILYIFFNSLYLTFKQRNGYSHNIIQVLNTDALAYRDQGHF